MLLPSYTRAGPTLHPPHPQVLADPNFVTSLKTYDKDNVKPAIIDRIRKEYTCNADFTPANAAKASSAAEGLCKWVCAMDSYDKVAKVVAPKKAALAEAEGTYNTVMAALNIKQAELKEVCVCVCVKQVFRGIILIACREQECLLCLEL